MTTARERILQKLNPELLKMTPKLSAENGSFINLDSDDSLEEGTKQLMMRLWRNQDLCEKNSRDASQTEVKMTVTSARYNEGNEICEILSERLKLPCSKKEEDFFCDRPGKNLQELKKQLQEKMSAKWEEEYKKRVSENKLSKGFKEYNKKHKEKKYLDEEENSDEDFDRKDCFEGGEKDEEGSDEDGCEGDVENEDDDDDSEEEEVYTKKNDATSIIEAKQTSTDNISKGMEFEDLESCSLPPAYQPGGGLLYGGSELTQCDEDLPQNLLSPSLELSVTESPQFKSLNDSSLNGRGSLAMEELKNVFSVRSKLFSQNPNDSFDLNDAYEFCSGKFPDEYSNSHLGTEGSTSQISNCASEEDDSESKEDEEEADGNEDESSDVCDKSEDKDSSRTANGPKVRKNIITFDDSEDEKESGLPEVEEFHSTSRILSDDEEKADDKTKKRNKNLLFSDEEEDGESDKEEGDKKDEEGSVYYDSEENEIINPKEFFEREAELSGSEWSGDEDERGLDEFDVEDGDADNLDNDQVRSQLEKIHLRRVLDDDAREVRLIQEILFEDGDLHSDGKGRDRKFRWKNLGGAFEENGEADAKGEGGGSSEDEVAEEEQQRKLRHEKELFLMEKKRNGDEDSDEEIIEYFQSVKANSVESSVKVSRMENSRTVLNCIEMKEHLLSKSRGSFLTRNEEFLSRLAKVTSGISDNVLGPKHSKNFVFVTKSPKKVEPNTACKRQVDVKEVRGRGHHKKFKILPPDVDTGPTILDLLI